MHKNCKNTKLSNYYLGPVTQLTTVEKVVMLVKFGKTVNSVISTVPQHCYHICIRCVAICLQCPQSIGYIAFYVILAVTWVKWC